MKMEMILLLGNVDSLYGHQSFRSRALAAIVGVAMPKEAAREATSGSRTTPTRFSSNLGSI